jgi:hypothetical protein
MLVNYNCIKIRYLPTFLEEKLIKRKINSVFASKADLLRVSDFKGPWTVARSNIAESEPRTQHIRIVNNEVLETSTPN